MKPKPYNRAKRFVFELSRSQLLLGFTALLLILSVVFVLGIFVGQGYVSETITRTFTERIKKLEEEKNALLKRYLTPPPQPRIPEEEVVDPKLNFYRDLAKQEGAQTQEVIPKPTPLPSPSPATDLPMSSPSPGDLKTRSKIPGPTAPPIKTDALPDQGKNAVKEAAKETKTPNVGLKNESSVLAVQVGSYRDEATARALAKRLAAKGYPAQVKSKDLPEKGGKWHRVQIGPYSNRFEAEKTVIHLEHDGFQGVVVENR